jgi:aryl carrier-like protein
MTAIWRDVFGIDTIGPNDNFFALGGNSFLASSLAERVTRRWGMEIAFDQVFEHQTIEQLCAYVRSRQRPARRRPKAP